MYFTFFLFIYYLLIQCVVVFCADGLTFVVCLKVYVYIHVFLFTVFEFKWGLQTKSFFSTALINFRISDKYLVLNQLEEGLLISIDRIKCFFFLCFSRSHLEEVSGNKFDNYATRNKIIKEIVLKKRRKFKKYMEGFMNGF